ncbi:hypothetical protein HDU89_006278 [Geranomyces variabilis]|nr:hypothetical protein HDU89_006278 [Geranomyces variabilis]
MSSLREKDMREGLVRQYLREREVRYQAQQDHLRERQRDQDRRDLVAERVAAMMARGVGGGGEGPPALGGEGGGEGEIECGHEIGELRDADKDTIGYVLAEQLFEGESLEGEPVGAGITNEKEGGGRPQSPSKKVLSARERRALESEKGKRELKKKSGKKDAGPSSPIRQHQQEVNTETLKPSATTTTPAPAAPPPPTPSPESPKPTAAATEPAPTVVAAPLATISSPTPRRVLTITPAKKPVVLPAPEPTPVVAAKPAAPTGRRSAARAAKTAAAVAAATAGKEGSQMSSDDKSSEPVASVVKRASKSKLDESSSASASSTAATRQKPAVVVPMPEPVAEPEVEAILGRKPKKRKEKKVALPRTLSAAAAAKTAVPDATAVAGAEATTSSATPASTSSPSPIPPPTQHTNSDAEDTPAANRDGQRKGSAVEQYLEEFAASRRNAPPRKAGESSASVEKRDNKKLSPVEEYLAHLREKTLGAPKTKPTLSALEMYLEDIAADRRAKAAKAAPQGAPASQPPSAPMQQPPHASPASIAGRKIATPKPVVDRKSANAAAKDTARKAQPQQHPPQPHESGAIVGANGGEIDLEMIDAETLANAISQLTAGYTEYYAQHHNGGGNGAQEQLVEKNQPEDDGADDDDDDYEDEEDDDDDEDLDATASFDLDALGIDLGQLDALAAGLGHHVGAAGGHPGASLSVDVDGVPVTIDANAFIDQALEGLATTAAFLYEGLEAQAEKVRVQAEKARHQEEGKGKRKDNKAIANAPNDATRGNIDKVAAQVTKLEQYAAKLQERVVHTEPGGGCSSSAVATSGKPKGKAPVAAARKTSATTTANWTTEDWKAKCRSVEVVMKRVREARDMRRRQKEGAASRAGTAAAGGVGAQPASSVATLADVLNMTVDVAAVADLNRPHEHEDDEDDDDDDHGCGLCNPDHEGMAEHADVPSPADMVGGDTESDVSKLWSLEGNHMQRLLETVRLLVSSGEMLASTPSPAAVNCAIPATANADPSGSGGGARATSTHSRKKRRKVGGTLHAPQPSASRRGMAPAPTTPPILFDAEIMVYLRDLVNASGPAGPPTATLTAFNYRGDPEPIVFDPARLLAGIADGVIDFGTPIPWEMLGLSGPPRWSAPVSAATTPSPPPLIADEDDAEGYDDDDADDDGEDAEESSSSARRRRGDGGGGPTDDNLAVLEARLAESRRLERDLERHLAGAVASNRAWTADIAEALDLDAHVVDVVTALPFEMGEGYLALIPPATAAGSSGGVDRVCVHRHDARGVHVDRSGRPLGAHNGSPSCKLRRNAAPPSSRGKQAEVASAQPANTSTTSVVPPPAGTTTTMTATATTTAPFFPAEPIVVDARVLLDTPGFDYDFAQRHSMTSPTCSLD